MDTVDYSIILGGGISGVSSALAERRRGRDVVVIDERSLPEKRRAPLLAASVAVWENVTDSAVLAERLKMASIDLQERTPKIVASPGLSTSHWLYSFFKQANLSIVSEVDNALSELGQPLVGVTGTNGKTTTVNLIHQLLLHAGLPSTLCGNVGYAPSELCAVGECELLENSKKLVMELSSYQLETSRLAVPEVAVLLNLAPDHLERHKSFEGYLAAKARLVAVGERRAKFSVVPAGDVLFHGDDFSGSCGRGYFGSLAEVSTISAPLHVAFDEQEGKLHCAYSSLAACSAHEVTNTASLSTAIIDITAFKLYGRHNLQNLAAAVLAALFCGASPASIEATIPSLQPVEHRLEPVGTLDGVFFVNDSKATNLDALFAGYEAITTRYRPETVTILVGGRAKKEDWKIFADKVAGHINCSLVFGESADMIVENLQKASQARYQRAGCLEEAVAKAWGCTASGGVILLSPGCASFDAYESFEERGSHFRKIFARLEQDDSRSPSGCLGDSISAS